MFSLTGRNNKLKTDRLGAASVNGLDGAATGSAGGGEGS